MAFTDLLEHTIYLQTVTSSQNAFGEWTESYTTSTTGTSCRMSPLTGEEMTAATGRWDDVSYKGFFASGTSINLTDRLVYGSDTFRVKDRIIDSNFHHITTLLVKL